MVRQVGSVGGKMSLLAKRLGLICQPLDEGLHLLLERLHHGLDLSLHVGGHGFDLLLQVGGKGLQLLLDLSGHGLQLALQVPAWLNVKAQAVALSSATGLMIKKCPGLLTGC